MAADDGFKIAGEVFVESGRGTVGFSQGYGFGEQPPWPRPDGPQHCHWPGVFLDEDLLASPYSRKHGGKIPYCFLLRDMHDRHSAIIADSSYFRVGAFEQGAQQLHQLLDSRGIPNEFHIYPGRHDPQFVIRHFGEVMRF